MIARVPTREEILATADRLKVECVDVPEWGDGCYVVVREMTSGQSSQFNDLGKGKTSQDENAKLVSIVTYDNAGTRDEPKPGTLLFTPKDVDDLSKLGVSPIARIVNKAIELSGLRPAQAKDMEKNSEATALPASGTV